MLTQPILEKLRQMKLLGLAEAFSSQSQQVDVQGLSFEERFGLLVDQEWTYRQDRRLARLLKEARLRLPACPEDIDYQPPRGLDRSPSTNPVEGARTQASLKCLRNSWLVTRKNGANFRGAWGTSFALCLRDLLPCPSRVFRRRP